MSYSVKSYMSKDVYTINGEEIVTEAAKSMAEKKSDYLIVLKEGKPVGIITDFDLVSKVLAKESDPSKIKVFEILSCLPCILK